jgi:hypothetical protein
MNLQDTAKLRTTFLNTDLDSTKMLVNLAKTELDRDNSLFCSAKSANTEKLPIVNSFASTAIHRNRLERLLRTGSRPLRAQERGKSSAYEWMRLGAADEQGVAVCGPRLFSRQPAAFESRRRQLHSSDANR